MRKKQCKREKEFVDNSINSGYFVRSAQVFKKQIILPRQMSVLQEFSQNLTFSPECHLQKYYMKYSQRTKNQKTKLYKSLTISLTHSEI